MGLTRDFASLPHDRFALIEKEVFPQQRPECNEDAGLAKYPETQDREWRVRLTSGVQTTNECHAGPRGGTERSDSDIAISCRADRG
jgi:hypothetical protein